MVRGFGSVVLVLGAIPLAGTALIWLGRAPVLLALALTALCSAGAAYRLGASGWAVLWGVAAGALTVVFVVAAFYALLIVSAESSGCPDGGIYC